MASYCRPSAGMSPLLLAFVACAGLLWMADSGEALTCQECKYWDCSRKPLKCPYGTTKDVCGCCDVCANGVGQECGGDFGILGNCGKGLRCERGRRGNEALPYEMMEGICVQDTPPRRRPTVPIKWKKLGEECGGRRNVFGKCVKGLRCDRSPWGNAATPIVWRKGVCVLKASEAEPAAKMEKKVPGLRPDSTTESDKASEKERTTPSPKQEPDNGLNALHVPRETPPLWYVRASWLQRRRDAIDSDRREDVTGRREEKRKRKVSSRRERPEAEEPASGLRYF